MKEFNQNDSVRHKTENGSRVVGIGNTEVVINNDPSKALLSGDEETVYKAEWRIVAMTIDRCLLILFLSIFVIATISCFGGTKFVS